MNTNDLKGFTSPPQSEPSEPSEPILEWCLFTDPRPYPVVMGLAHDGEKILVIHRSKRVRSAADAWSVITGLHEVGRTMTAQLSVEMMEEFHLTLDEVDLVPDFVYESIRPNGDCWHWVINLFVCRVKNFDDIINLEPDKHDEFKLLSYHDFADMVLDRDVVWTPGLKAALMEVLPILERQVDYRY